MKKTDRIRLIKKLLIAHEIKTQDELVTALLDLKIEVTQATISRDMRELRLVKVPAKTGGYRYALPESSHKHTDSDLFETIAIQGEQLAIKTSPGSAMLLKNRLWKRFENLIFTVLSDDDTVLLIATSDENAIKIHQSLTN
jgi:transcriptional regulator of arginine metabolism